MSKPEYGWWWDADLHADFTFDGWAQGRHSAKYSLWTKGGDLRGDLYVASSGLLTRPPPVLDVAVWLP